MALRTETFVSESELKAFCNGGLRLGVGPEKLNLDGLTLTTTTPNGSVTFSGTALSMPEINAQITADGAPMNELKLIYLQGRLWLIEKTPTNGIVLPASGNTAIRQALGISTVGDITTVVLAKEGGTAPARVKVERLPRGGWMLQWETA